MTKTQRTGIRGLNDTEARDLYNEARNAGDTSYGLQVRRSLWGRKAGSMTHEEYAAWLDYRI